jgi:hypothetical protein
MPIKYNINIKMCIYQTNVSISSEQYSLSDEL